MSRCKLCPRVFSNGRALGGHMRSHLATLSPPPAKKSQLADRTQSDSSSTRSGEFLDAGSVVVQDRESETESTRDLTRRRVTKRPSQRTREVESKKKKKKSRADGMKSESVTELSSVSDPSQDEEVALCLMMLSRDVWVVEENDSAELKTQSSGGSRFKCLECKKRFKSKRAFDGHRVSSKECQKEENFGENGKIYECPFCYKVFGSGQALGGHKRSHLVGVGSSPTVHLDHDHHHHDGNDKVGDTTSFILDLNLPAPVEDEEDF